jgi:cytochrome c553
VTSSGLRSAAPRFGQFLWAALAALPFRLDAQAPLAPLTLPGDPARGELLAYTCSGCHGIAGYQNAYPAYHVPKLGGQNPDYIEVALQGYRAGSRQHPTMRAQAAAMSDQDIADLAAWFATLAAVAEQGSSAATRSEIAAGRQKSVACQPCHGTDGLAEGPQWPNLAGQHASYLIEALQQYRRGTRADLLMGPMIGALDDQTIGELAAYYAALPGLYGTGQ